MIISICQHSQSYMFRFKIHASILFQKGKTCSSATHMSSIASVNVFEVRQLTLIAYVQKKEST